MQNILKFLSFFLYLSLDILFFSSRGRAAFTRTIKTEVAAKAQVKVNSRTQASLMKTTADCCPTPEKAAAEGL